MRPTSVDRMQAVERKQAFRMVRFEKTGLSSVPQFCVLAHCFVLFCKIDPTYNSPIRMCLSYIISYYFVATAVDKHSVHVLT